jgi:hypothetical protein
MTAENEQREPANTAGMPEANPPEGSPNQDPNVPDPGDLVPGRPGPPEQMPKDRERDETQQ